MAVIRLDLGFVHGLIFHHLVCDKYSIVDSEEYEEVLLSARTELIASNMSRNLESKQGQCQHNSVYKHKHHR